MNELIEVKEIENKQVVSGRELHKLLEIDTPYSIWIKRMIEYGFVEEVDFITFLLESTGGRPSEDHELTIEMSKQICMIQRSEIGTRVRLYFIECEKIINEKHQRNYLLGNIYEGGSNAIESTKKLVELETNELRQQIEHKENVIINLVDKTTLDNKRQIINRVVRFEGANFQKRWSELYNQFEMKYHIDLNARLERYNQQNKPKIKNKIDYIDKVMNKTSELYDIACLLYESDIKTLTNRMYQLNNKN